MTSSSDVRADGDFTMEGADRLLRSPSYSPKLSNASVTRGESVDSSKSRSRSRSRSIDESQGYDDRRSPLSVDNTQQRSFSERTSAAVEIKGLTEMVFEQHVDQIFCQYGRIEQFFIPRWQSGHELRGVAYVVYQSSSQAAKAIRHMDEGQIDGAIIRVRSIDEDSLVFRTATHNRRDRSDHRRRPDDRRRRPDRIDDRRSRDYSRKRSRSPAYDHH